MKIQYLFLLILFIGVFSCNALRSNKRELDTNLKFDIAYFTKYRIQNTARDTLRNGTIVILSDGEYYSEEIKKRNSLYSVNYQFYKKNYNIRSSRTSFYDATTGIYKEYDENGQIVKSIDYNSFYKFSIKDLIILFKDKYKIDLMNSKDVVYVVSGDRFNPEYTQIPEYTILIRGKSPKFRQIKINGINGKIILDLPISSFEF